MEFGGHMLPADSPIENSKKKFKAIENAFWASELAIKRMNLNYMFWFFFGAIVVLVTLNYADTLTDFYVKTFLTIFNETWFGLASLFLFSLTIFVEVWLIMFSYKWIDRKLALSVFSDKHRAFCYSILVHKSLTEYLNSPKNNAVFLKNALNQFNTLSNIVLETTVKVDGKELTIPIDSLIEIVETYDWMRLEGDSKQIAELLIKLKGSFPLEIAKRDRILELSKSMEWIILRTHDSAFSNKKATTSVLSAQLDSMRLQDFMKSMKPILEFTEKVESRKLLSIQKSRKMWTLFREKISKNSLLEALFFAIGFGICAWLVYVMINLFTKDISIIQVSIAAAVAGAIYGLTRNEKKREA